MPTLNEEKYLPKLLEDLANQTFDNFEVIIVDGKSEDKTLQITERFAKKITIHTLTSPKRKVAFQRNYGAKNAKGDFVIFLDADSRVEPKFLKTIDSYIQKYKHLVYIPAIAFDEKQYEYTFIQNFINFILETSQFLNKPFSNGGSIIMQKNVFEFLGGFNEKLYISEDHEIIQRAKECGISAKFIKDISVVFSLRRISKEGKLTLLSKYVYAAFQTMLKGKIEDKIFNYEMGGQEYSVKTEKKSQMSVKLKEQYTKYKKELNKLILHS